MRLIGALHQNGTTIAMVTHSPEYAKYADRVVSLLDGQVVQDGQQV
jgi:putative ABC transport system ATP-binding protein